MMIKASSYFHSLFQIMSQLVKMKFTCTGSSTTPNKLATSTALSSASTWQALRDLLSHSFTTTCWASKTTTTWTPLATSMLPWLPSVSSGLSAFPCKFSWAWPSKDTCSSWMSRTSSMFSSGVTEASYKTRDLRSGTGSPTLSSSTTWAPTSRHGPCSPSAWCQSSDPSATSSSPTLSSTWPKVEFLGYHPSKWKTEWSVFERLDRQNLAFVANI